MKRKLLQLIMFSLGLSFYISCGPPDRTIEPKFANNNCINVLFYSKDDSTVEYHGMGGYNNFRIMENGNFNKLEYFNDKTVVIPDLIEFLNNECLVFPYFLESKRNTIILSKDSTNDTIIVDNIAPEIKFVNDEIGYQVSFKEAPTITYSSIKIYGTPIFQKSNNVMYLRLFLKN